MAGVNGTLKRKIAQCAVILTGICLFSGGGVGVLYVVNRDRIAENQLKAFRQALTLVLGEVDAIEELGEYPPETSDDAKVYVGKTDRYARYVAAGQAQGYQSVIKVLVSIEVRGPDAPVPEDPAVYRMAVVSSGETPGLGENINEVKKELSLWGALYGLIAGRRAEAGSQRPAFQEQFSRKRLGELVVGTGPETDRIWPITGATISSRAATEAAGVAVRRIISACADEVVPMTGANRPAAEDAEEQIHLQTRGR